MVPLRLLLAPLAAVLLVASASGAEDPSPWALPPPGSCTSAVAGDAVPFPLREGEIFEVAQLEALRPFLPEEVWSERDRLFSPDMRLEIGPCFRSYAPPEFFDEATRRYAGQAKLLPNVGLEGTPAGLPFPPETIAADDPEAGRKWAWNAVRRYQGAGRFGALRLTYLDERGVTTNLVGEYFVAQLLGRSDRPAPDHRLSFAKKKRWASGGRSRDPSTGAHCSFRHYRDADAEREARASDDVFLYTTRSRKPERVGWAPEVPLLACAYERGWYLPRGFTPQSFRWRVAGVRDVLAPINVRGPSAGTVTDFGPSGASLASNRWELRRVLVLESSEPGARAIRRYLDLETLFPLYHMDGPMLLQWAGRWSEDRGDYPSWLDDPERPVRVIDPVARILLAGPEIIRVETWDTVAVPPEEKAVRNLVSQSSLGRR